MISLGMGCKMIKDSTNSCVETIPKNNSYYSKDGRYQTLFQQVNAAAFLTSYDGKILEANLRSCELLGYKWDELTKLSLREIFPTERDWADLIDEITAKGGLNFESENVRKDGTRFPVDISISLFTLDKKPVLFALIWDITHRKKAEQELKASQEKFEGIFQCTTDGMIVLDARGEILDVNAESLVLFDLKENELIGKNLLGMGVLTPKAMSIIVKQFQELLSNRKSTSKETEIIDKNGKKINVELTSFFLLRKDNEIDNFVLVIRDINDRKQTEIKLAREHELLQTLMDSIPDSIYFKDEENKFIMVNKAKAASLDVSAEQMIGKNDFDFLPPDNARKAFENDEDIINTGKFIINQIENITNKDGSKSWVSVTKIPRFDEFGNIIGIMSISRDVTEWKRLECQQKKDNI